MGGEKSAVQIMRDHYYFEHFTTMDEICVSLHPKSAENQCKKMRSKYDTLNIRSCRGRGQKFLRDHFEHHLPFLESLLCLSIFSPSSSSSLYNS